jgi:hypothetical protein
MNEEKCSKKQISLMIPGTVHIWNFSGPQNSHIKMARQNLMH